MITIGKLKTLGKKTMLRKTVLVLRQTELDAGETAFFDRAYLRDICQLVRNAAGENVRVVRACVGLENSLIGEIRDTGEIRRGLYLLRSVLQEHLGVSAGDWDFYEPGTSRLDGSKRITLPLRVYLDDIRSPFNVGSIFRTADSFGVERITVSPCTADPRHRRAVRTSMGCTDTIPWEEREPVTLMEEPGVFALELGGISLEEFVFPDVGTVVIGSEELGVGPEALEAADTGYGRVSIPLSGTKGSLNVSVAFGILMHAWWLSRKVARDSSGDFAGNQR